jgi:RNA polymerase sigma-70 factor (ECF subfamily)
MGEQHRWMMVRRAFKGDADSFRQLVLEYQGPVYNMCVRYVGLSEAEDIAQETFIRAFLNKEKFDPNRAVLPWLFTVARNLCIDRIRQTRRETPFESASADGLMEPAADGPAPEDVISDRQLLGMVEETLQSLPEGRREALMLVDVEGMSYQETADILKVPIGTVMTWLHRGRERLRELLAKRQNRVQKRLSDKEVTA